jgi:arabinosaccharide transport system substrate-binding protein
MQFPFGTAALALTVLAVGAGSGITLVEKFTQASDPRPDLIMATFAKDHVEAYLPAIAAFEKANNCKVQIQLVSQRALTGRLQSAMQVGAEVPDMVELLGGTMGVFVRGPVKDVGFLDLNDRVKAEGLEKKLVASRFELWSSRGHQYALPHDVHPVMLAYRKDLVEQLGIDVTTLKTWDDFARVGREITKDLNGDGVIDRYMIDLPADGGDALRLLLLQRGARLFDEQGNVTFDDARSAQVVCWYVRQSVGKTRISFPAGWGQNLARSMVDGLCLFYICPDWRTKQFEADVQGVNGKMGLMPLPAWEEGGIRTSTWGGTGLAITKQCKNPDLAWKLAMYLYYDPAQLGPRFKGTNILPPLVSAWSQPEFNEPDPYYSGAVRGREFAALAPQVPGDPTSTSVTAATGKLSEAFQNVGLYYQEHGEDGLEAYAAKELKRCADRVRVIVGRNVFLKDDESGENVPGGHERELIKVLPSR